MLGFANLRAFTVTCIIVDINMYYFTVMEHAKIKNKKSGYFVWCVRVRACVDCG
jgi:hypothetical protein